MFYRLFFLGLVLLWGLNLKAQEIEVSYQATVKIIENTDKKTSDAFKKLASDCNKSLNNVNFKSISNGSLQRFFYEDVMVSDFNGDIWLKLALIWAMDGKQVYTDYTDGIAYYESDQISKIRSVKTTNIDWIISNDSKEILGYTCYRATAKIVDSDEENKLTVPTIAWFCPKLAKRGGPTAYATLPGTILELESEKIKFVATEVEININNNITLPEYKMKDVLSHKEWNEYFSANNPIPALRSGN